MEELKRTVPKGAQSKVVGEALRNELKRIKFQKALEESFGAWKGRRHPELAKGASWQAVSKQERRVAGWN